MQLLYIYKNVTETIFIGILKNYSCLLNVQYQI